MVLANISSTCRRAHPRAPAGALVRHVDDIRAAHRLELVAGHVQRRTGGADREIELAGILPGVVDQFARVLDRHPAVGDQHARDGGDDGDRREVLDRIERKLLVERGVDRVAGEALIRMVSASGLLLATMSAAMLPPAPALFSTITGRFSTCPMTSLIVRASVSVCAPGGAPTMIFKGRSCASAAVGMQPRSATDREPASDLAKAPMHCRRGRRTTHPPSPAAGTVLAGVEPDCHCCLPCCRDRNSAGDCRGAARAGCRLPHEGLKVKG